VSDAVTLTLRSAPDGPLDLEGVTPDRVATLTAAEIAALPLWAGMQASRVGDHFDVVGERADTLRIVGATERLDGVGAGMTGGTLLVEGGLGRRAGAAMRGGTLDVRGSVGGDAGAAMVDGVLRVAGDAGDRLGAATPGAAKGMLGGEIVVRGSAGAEAGARARRGLIVVGGDCGPTGARAMIAGTLVVLGRVGPGAGVQNKRGSVVVVGDVEVPSTYRFACTYQPPHLRLTFTHLRRRHVLVVDARVLDGRWRRYVGDAGEPGRGEILAWTGE
jgi:formylmethanofuran dehydrogenase subunit C